MKTPESLRPEETFTVEVKSRAPKTATYTLAVVDEGLLGLTRFRTRPITSSSVSTATSSRSSSSCAAARSWAMARAGCAGIDFGADHGDAPSVGYELLHGQVSDGFALHLFDPRSILPNGGEGVCQATIPTVTIRMAMAVDNET